MARRLFIAAIVAVALGGPIVEAFDSWDQTVKDGNDTEANAVIAALCVGCAFVVSPLIVSVRQRALLSTSAAFVIATRAIARGVVSLVAPIPTSSPPAVLRV